MNKWEWRQISIRNTQLHNMSFSMVYIIPEIPYFLALTLWIEVISPIFQHITSEGNTPQINLSDTENKDFDRGNRRKNE